MSSEIQSGSSRFSALTSSKATESGLQGTLLGIRKQAGKRDAFSRVLERQSASTQEHRQQQKPAVHSGNKGNVRPASGKDLPSRQANAITSRETASNKTQHGTGQPDRATSSTATETETSTPSAQVTKAELDSQNQKQSVAVVLPESEVNVELPVEETVAGAETVEVSLLAEMAALQAQAKSCQQQDVGIAVGTDISLESTAVALSTQEASAVEEALQAGQAQITEGKPAEAADDEPDAASVALFPGLLTPQTETSNPATVGSAALVDGDTLSSNEVATMTSGKTEGTEEQDDLLMSENPVQTEALWAVGEGATTSEQRSIQGQQESALSSQTLATNPQSAAPASLSQDAGTVARNRQNSLPAEGNELAQAMSLDADGDNLTQKENQNGGKDSSSISPPQTPERSGLLREQLVALAQQMKSSNGPSEGAEQVKSETASDTKPVAFGRTLEQFGAMRTDGGKPVSTGIQTPVGQKEWANELGQRLVMMVSSKLKSAEIHLNPKDLGPMEVRIRMHEDRAHVVFTSQVTHTREALEQAMPRLREMMEQNGIALGNADVQDQGTPHSHQQEQAEGGKGRGSAANEDPSVAEVASPAVVKLGLVDYYA